MIKKLNDIVFLVLFCGIVCLIGCNNLLADKSNKSRSLSNHFKNHFHVGAAINENTILGNDNKSKEIVVSEFNEEVTSRMLEVAKEKAAGVNVAIASFRHRVRFERNYL